MQGTATAIVLVAVALLLMATACGFPLFRGESARFQAARQARAADPICPNFLCDLSAGSSCSDYSNSTYHSCAGTNFCDYSGNLTCVERYPLGHECTSIEQCVGESTLVSIECSLDESSGKQYCTKNNPGGMPGDACTNNTDCKTNVCTAAVCQGHQERDICTKSSLCAPGLYCNTETSVCVPARAENENCMSDEECAPSWTGRGCLLGKCQFPFQAKEGEGCEPGIANICGSNLYCDPESNSCQQYQRIECTSIGNDTECKALPQTSCICSSLTGSGVCSSQYVEHYSAAAIQYYYGVIQCASRYSCVIDPYSKCFMDNCVDYYDCYAFEFFKEQGMDFDLNCFGFTTKCNPPPPDPSSSHHSPSTTSEQQSTSGQHSPSTTSEQQSTSGQHSPSMTSDQQSTSGQHSPSTTSDQKSASMNSDSGHYSPSASEHHYSESSSGNHSASESGQHSGNVSVGAKITPFDALAALAAAAVGAFLCLN